MKHLDRINTDRRPGTAFFTRYGWATIFTAAALAFGALAIYAGRH